MSRTSAVDASNFGGPSSAFASQKSNVVGSDFTLRLAEPRLRRSGETGGETLQQGGNLCYLAPFSRIATTSP